MSAYSITPLAPAYGLLLGAFLVLSVGPILAARHRHRLVVAVSALACLGLVMGVAGDLAANRDAPLRVLAEWLGEPVVVLHSPAAQPLAWLLMLLLVVTALAGQAWADEQYPLGQAMLFLGAAAAYGLVLAGTARTLAFAWLVFQGVAALIFLAHRRPVQAVGRLLAGMLACAVVLGVSQGVDAATPGTLRLGGVFSLIVWLQVGVYPLLESDSVPGSTLPGRLCWSGLNLLAGLYLAATGVAAWMLWPALTTTLLHGVLAWLEPSRERALMHAANMLAGAVVVLAAAGGDAQSILAASISALAGLLALGLTPARLGHGRRPHRVGNVRLWLAYLPPGLASLTWIGLPLTLGWPGRATLYGAVWVAKGPLVVAWMAIAEGAALAVLYRYWQLLLRAPEQPERPSAAWQPLAAGLAALPLLIPLAAEWLWTPPGPARLDNTDFGPFNLEVWTGLAGVWLWAFFLGYGRDWLLNAILPVRPAVLRGLRMGWLVSTLGRMLDMLSRVLLRVRVVVEGEHYLAWAILLAICLGLWMTVHSLEVPR
jgi:hypothetical protein